MSLRDRLSSAPAPAPAWGAARAAQEAPAHASATYQRLKTRVHQLLLERIDLEALEGMSPERVRDELSQLVERLLLEENVVVNAAERRTLVRDVQHEMLGLGPLEPLLADPTVSDILVNGARQVYVERKGQLAVTDVTFSDDDHLMKIIDKIVSRVGRRVDESSPMADARLPDGSRVNVIIPPLALDGPVVSIRRFGKIPLMIEDLVRLGSIGPEMVTLLRAMVRARLNVLVSGGTGSGKTTLLNCLSAFVPDNERIVTIEDSAELQLQQPHVVRLETRPQNVEGRGEVTQRDLLRNSLRMRPDRIIVGEVRGAESLDMLQAMNTGHDGSISTVHANSARDSLNRLEMMMQMAGFELPIRAMRQQISLALDVIVHTARMNDGTRKVTSITEVVGMEGDTVMLQDLFVFQREGTDEHGRITGRFMPTGIRPRFADNLKATGQAADAQAFDYLRN